jgi:hypothetical protein
MRHVEYRMRNGEFVWCITVEAWKGRFEIWNWKRQIRLVGSLALLLQVLSLGHHTLISTMKRIAPSDIRIRRHVRIPMM